MATTFDVYKKGNKILVKFDNKEMTLADFVQKAANKDPEAIEVLSKLKQHPKFKQAGSLQTFLTQYLKDDDKRLDLIIKNKITQYDDEEIARNSGDNKTNEPAKKQSYIPPRNIKPLPSPRKNRFYSKEKLSETTMRLGT